MRPAPEIALLFDPQPTPHAEATEIIRAALVRSFSSAPIRMRTFGNASSPEAAAVAISPPESAAQELAAFTEKGRKLLLLGSLGPRVAALAGIEPTRPVDLLEEETLAHAQTGTPFDVSPARWVWNGPSAPGGEALPVRAFCRFDFEEEWNHLGHGRVRAGAGIWGLATTESSGEATELAEILVGDEPRGVAATRLDRADASTMWIGRPVATVDGLDHAVLERFFSDHRHGELPCWPSWCDWPPGFAGAATARLDCDEAIASARPLFEKYRERGVPLSLAVLAGLAMGEEDRRLIRDILASGGTILSHSTRHLPDWGCDFAEARAEARGSRETLESEFPEAAPVRFAVSPFHRNPAHAIRAVADSGYDALVTGIIANDPACTIGRGGVLPFSDPPLVSHTQQNMLHGDCFARCEGTIAPWRESFENHRRAGALYGYLDHPFSERYAYGWESEGQRIAAHEALLDAFEESGTIWLPSQGQALSHLVRRSRSELRCDDAGRPCADGPGGPNGPDGLTVRFAGGFLGL